MEGYISLNFEGLYVVSQIALSLCQPSAKQRNAIGMAFRWWADNSGQCLYDYWVCFLVGSFSCDTDIN